jgi:hypothetical protein
VTVTARHSVSARPCPLLYEQLWLWKQNRVVTRQYVLNCAAVGTAFAASRRYVFAQRLPVPADGQGHASVEVGLEDDVSPIPAVAPLDQLLDSGVSPNGYSESYRGNDITVDR